MKILTCRQVLVDYPRPRAVNSQRYINNVGVATISGNPVVGNILMASVSDRTTNATTNNTFTYQWMSGGNNVGINANTYTLSMADLGNTLVVNVTYTDDDTNAENITSITTSAVISIQQDAINTISATTNNAGGSLAEEAYADAGVTGVTAEILDLINIAVARQSVRTDADSTAEIQALVDAVTQGQDGDNDGLPALVEGLLDTDGDSIIDSDDVDSDNDGIADLVELDLDLTDSEPDGIIDIFDAGVGNDGTVDPTKLDANFDGVDDNLDSLAEVMATILSVNQDNDIQPNHLDLELTMTASLIWWKLTLWMPMKMHYWMRVIR